MASFEQLKPFVNSRVLRVIDILRYYNPSTRERNGAREQLMSGLIFVKERYVAYVFNVSLFLFNRHFFNFFWHVLFGFLEPF